MFLFQIAIDNAKKAERVRMRLSDKYDARFYEMENGISWICPVHGGTASGCYDADLWEKRAIWRDEK